MDASINALSKQVVRKLRRAGKRPRLGLTNSRSASRFACASSSPERASM